MPALETVADRQAVWSATANSLKKSVDSARWSSFIFSIGGALAAALSTQFETLKTPLAIIGAIALAIAAFLTSRFLTKDALSRHVRARAASEALKREAFLFATRSAPYADANDREQFLVTAREKIENDLDDLERFVVAAGGKGSCPRSELTREAYLKDRLGAQINFYNVRADEYTPRSKILHTLEWVLALAAAILTGISGVIGKTPLDWASITAVFTTIGGAVLAHLQASRYDELISSYRSTARRLIDARDRLEQNGSLSDIAKACEDIIATETKSWSAMWSRG